MGLFSFINKKKFIPDEPLSTRSVFTYSGGSLVTPDTSMKVSAFYSGVIYISTQVAKLPWYIKDSKNKKQNNKLSYLLNYQPNPEMDSMDFRLRLLQSAIIYGNGFAEIERNTMGQPVALWLLPPRSVQVTRLDNKLVYRVLGASPFDHGQDAYLQPNDIIHLKNFFLTEDGLAGQGVAGYASEALGIALGADTFANSLFANGGMPSGTLEVEGALSEEALTRIKKSWKVAHSGRKTGGTAILEEGLKFKPISYDPKILQFLESRQFSVIEIARFLRVPPTKLYAQEAAKFNNIEQENLQTATDTLSSWCKRLEIQVDVKLLNPMTGRHSELDLTDLFRGDMDTRSNYFSRMMQNGSMTANEIREKEGMEPYAEGDEFYIATNNFTPISRMNEVIDSQISKSSESDKKEVDPEEKELNNAIVDYLKNKK